MNRLSKIALFSLAVLMPAVPVLAAALAPMNFTESRQRYYTAIDRYKDARTNFLNARLRLRRRRKKVEQLPKVDKDAYMERMRQFVLYAIGAMASYLESARTKADEAWGLDGKKKIELMEGIDTELAELDRMKEGVNNAKTIPDLRTIAQKARVLWPRARFAIRYTNEKFLIQQVDGFLDKIDEIYSRIEKEVNKLESNGKDASEIENFLKEFKNLQEQSHEDLEEASGKINQAKGSDNPYKLIRETHSALRRSRLKIREINVLLRQIKQAIDITL